MLCATGGCDPNHGHGLPVEQLCSHRGPKHMASFGIRRNLRLQIRLQYEYSNVPLMNYLTEDCTQIRVWVWWVALWSIWTMMKYDKCPGYQRACRIQNVREYMLYVLCWCDKSKITSLPWWIRVIEAACVQAVITGDNKEPVITSHNVVKSVTFAFHMPEVLTSVHTHVTEQSITQWCGS